MVESGVKGESMFTGKYIHNVEQKNRIIIPAKFRESTASGAYITLGLDQCLTIYPLDEWNKFIDKTLQLNTNSADVRKYIRIFHLMLLNVVLISKVVFHYRLINVHS